MRFLLNPGSATTLVAKQLPMFGKGAAVYFWAEHGLVHWRDEREGLPVEKQYGTMTWRDAAMRRLGLSEMMPSSAEDGGRNWRHERSQLQQFMCDLEKVIMQAREQGSPDEKDAAAEFRRRRPTTVIMPQFVEMD
jgi:hypothetical protein